MIASLPALTKLDRRRKSLGISLAVLARRSGVSLPSVQRILTGREATPSLSTLHAIAAALGLQLSIGHSPAITEEASAAAFRRARAVEKARQLARMVQGTMALEAQAVPQPTLDAIAEQNIADLLAGSGRRLWD